LTIIEIIKKITLRLDKKVLPNKICDLLNSIPVHSCLVVAALQKYQTLDGEEIETRLTE
jgi:D-serine deaminase-like pyridoxal phosphate-dependent protein